MGVLEFPCRPLRVMRGADLRKGTGLAGIRSGKEQPRSDAPGKAGDDSPQGSERCRLGLRRQGLCVGLSSAVHARIFCPDPVQVRTEILGGLEVEGELERGSARKAPGGCPAGLIVKNTCLVVFRRDINPVNPASKLGLFSRIEAKGNGNIGGGGIEGEGFAPIP